MRQFAILFVSILFFAWPDSVYSGELFKSDKLKFEIEFPAKPQQKVTTRSFTSGDAQTVRFKSIGKKIRPSIGVTIFSRDAFTPEEVARGLELSGQRQVSGLNGKIVSRTDLENNGFPGKETVIEGSIQGRTFFYRAQTYYAGNRQYILSVAAQTLAGVKGPADSYFASFKLLQ